LMLGLPIVGARLRAPHAVEGALDRTSWWIKQALAGVQCWPHLTAGLRSRGYSVRHCSKASRSRIPFGNDRASGFMLSGRGGLAWGFHLWQSLAAGIVASVRRIPEAEWPPSTHIPDQAAKITPPSKRCLVELRTHVFFARQGGKADRNLIPSRVDPPFGPGRAIQPFSG